MREINNHQERLAQVHALESARNILQIVNSLFDGLVGNSRSLRGSNRRQNIVDVDAARPAATLFAACRLVFAR